MAAVRVDDPAAVAGLRLEAESALPARLPTGIGGRALTRVVLVLLATVAAYFYSLGTLLADFSPARPLAYLGWVPLVAALAAAGQCLAPKDEPEIHDRYLDYIIGLPLLATALAAMVLLPARLSVFFWFWRLDLLSLPLFVAGAVSIVFGVRVLWRLRGPIALLLLAWPPPLLRSLDAARPLTGATMLAVGALALAVAPHLFGASGWNAFFRSRIRRAPTRSVATPSGRGPAVHRAGRALGIVLVGAILTAFADSSLRQSEQLIRHDGEPRIAGIDPQGLLRDWSLTKTVRDSRAERYFGAGAVWVRYTFVAVGPGRGSDGQVTVEVVSSPDAGVLGRHGMGLFDRLQDYALVDRRNVNLGAGLVGQTFTYFSQSQQATWIGVSWEWPVRTSNGVRYERVVAHMTALEGTSTFAPIANLLVQPSFAVPVADWLDGVGPNASAGTSLVARNFLVAFGRRLVASTLERAG
jgi:hypothetical protein